MWSRRKNIWIVAVRIPGIWSILQFIAPYYCVYSCYLRKEARQRHGIFQFKCHLIISPSNMTIWLLSLLALTFEIEFEWTYKTNSIAVLSCLAVFSYIFKMVLISFVFMEWKWLYLTICSSRWQYLRMHWHWHEHMMRQRLLSSNDPKIMIRCPSINF